MGLLSSLLPAKLTKGNMRGSEVKQHYFAEDGTEIFVLELNPTAPGVEAIAKVKDQWFTDDEGKVQAWYTADQMAECERLANMDWDA